MQRDNPSEVARKHAKAFAAIKSPESDLAQRIADAVAEAHAELETERAALDNADAEAETAQDTPNGQAAAHNE
jgi:hypothetical protein